MRSDRFVLGLALVTATVLMQAGPAAARDPAPFNGIFAGEYTVEPIVGTPTAKLVVSAIGIGTQVGGFEVEIPHVVNFAALSATGSYQFTAANGDKINATFTGHSTPIGTDGVYVLVVEEATITGGSGRFAGATGSFTAVRLVDRSNLETIGYFEGTISRPRRR